MSFSQSAILDATAVRSDANLVIAWASTAAAGTTYQVYVNRALAWRGTNRRAVLPWPGTASAIRVDVGTVAAGEGNTDFSGSLPAVAGGGQRAHLTWGGGKYLSPTIAGFHIYGQRETTGFGVGSFGAGGFGTTLDLSTPLASVTAYPQNVPAEGFGMGGFGTGGFGLVGSFFSWLSAPLANGWWAFAVRPFDAAGNEGPASVVTARVVAPPAPPAANSAGRRLTYTFRRGTPGGFGTGGFGVGGFGTGAGFGAGGFGLGGFGAGAGDGLPYLTLSWLASPG